MNTLLIFIKNPEKGKVKTRIAQTAGDERALQIYLELLRHTREICQQVNARRILFYSDFIEEDDGWSAQDFQKMVQHGTDLGERMSNAFLLGLISPEDKAVIIGSDNPLLTVEIVESAFAKLEDYPFVIGPATDGGYYLLGMRKHTPFIFKGIEWSTKSVFPETVKKVEALDAAYFLLPELPDVDYESDWEQYGWEIKEIK
ncbi:MAG: TIGR04282 family arsenosugar biosynthesis glycosyltransferase [Saprospiraceae bacterium]|nr:TIGR04282 family arsenosugar biosynthesis glycosyltransferase [Saprospiraceae bacterium]